MREAIVHYGEEWPNSGAFGVTAFICRKLDFFVLFGCITISGHSRSINEDHCYCKGDLFWWSKRRASAVGLSLVFSPFPLRLGLAVISRLKYKRDTLHFPVNNPCRLMATKCCSAARVYCFRGEMTMTCFHKGFHFIEPRQCVLSHSCPTCSHSPLRGLLKAGKPFATVPPHSLWTQWAFLIQAKDSYLGDSIQLPSLYFTPISLQILAKDIWVRPVNIFSPRFLHSVFVTIFCRLL